MAELANRSDEQTLPSQLILSNAAKIAIKEDKPIMLDYWTASLEKKVIIATAKITPGIAYPVMEKLVR